MSDGEEALAFQLKAVGLYFVREVKFHPSRQWRFDFVIAPKGWRRNTPLNVAAAVVVEVEGGTWVQGAHSRGRGFEEDAEKYAEALIAGWRVLRVTTAMVDDGRAVAFIERALAGPEDGRAQ